MPSEATTGMRADTLAKLLTYYAKSNPDAIVKFASGESGGYWPSKRRDMGVFVYEQVGCVDATRVGGDLCIMIGLLTFPTEKGPE